MIREHLIAYGLLRPISIGESEAIKAGASRVTPWQKALPCLTIEKSEPYWSGKRWIV